MYTENRHELARFRFTFPAADFRFSPAENVVSRGVAPGFYIVEY